MKINIFSLGVLCLFLTNVAIAVPYGTYGNQWTSWSFLTVCNQSCGGGVREKTRVCSLHWYGYYYSRFDSCSPNGFKEIQYVTCNTVCLNGGSYINGNCSCVQGKKGRCCEEIPVCSPQCQNNGTCVADDLCQCPSGFYGQRCEMGSDFADKLKPQLHTSLDEDDTLSPLSWYSEPNFSVNNKVCYVKVHVQDAPLDTVMTSTSSTEDGCLYGNFSTGPIDSSASLNDTSRFACLEVRCPFVTNDGTYSNTFVNIMTETGTSQCHIRKHTNGIANVTVHTTAGSSDEIEFVLEVGNNYGPYYGVYMGLGYRNKAKYLAEHNCYSGHQYDFNSFNPEIGILADIVC